MISVIPKIAIANATPFYRAADGDYVPASEWKSLMQWIAFMPNVTLLKPKLSAHCKPEGWMSIPDQVQVEALCDAGERYAQRRRSTLEVAAEALKNHDLLYIRMPNYEGFWCSCVARRLKISLLVELHGDWETAIEQEDHHSLGRRVTRRARALYARRNISQLCADAEMVVTIGSALAKKYVPAAVPKLITTNHLLQAKDYSPREDWLLHDPPTLLFVGDIQRRKGLHVLFEALCLMKKRGRQFHLKLVGSGPLKDFLFAYARSHGFGQQIEFLGIVSHGEELFQQFRNADLFILPSIAAEGVPRVTHEAMAMGCPVVATDIGSVGWQLRDEAGIVVPPNNPLALAEACEAVLSDVTLRARLSQNGFARSCEHTLEKQQHEIESFVKQKLGDHFRPHHKNLMPGPQLPA